MENGCNSVSQRCRQLLNCLVFGAWGTVISITFQVLFFSCFFPYLRMVCVHKIYKKTSPRKQQYWLFVQMPATSTYVDVYLTGISRGSANLSHKQRRKYWCCYSARKPFYLSCPLDVSPSSCTTAPSRLCHESNVPWKCFRSRISLNSLLFGHIFVFCRHFWIHVLSSFMIDVTDTWCLCLTCCLRFTLYLYFLSIAY